MSKNPQLKSLSELGQSIWYDNLSKEVLDNGSLQSLIDSGVVGLTSNPTIFKKAIADTDDYDERIAEILKDPKNEILKEDIDTLCEELMVEDVRRAADLLKPVYEKTNGNDGFASIEVSPTLSHDAKGTIEAAKRIYKKLERPNVMIKIPATDEGIVAIKETLKAGIPVNVTLIFSLKYYKKVIAAYCEALLERTQSSQDISAIRSVASFFVSRVDVAVEKEIEKLGDDTLRQKTVDRVGIANSLVAYNHYLAVLESDSCKEIQKSGGVLQRALWASTGTKKSELPKAYYVEQLAGADTVNTLPPATLAAVMEEANIENHLTKDRLEAAEALVNEINSSSAPFEETLDTLLKDGLESFGKSYEELIAALKEKVKKLQLG